MGEWEKENPLDGIRQFREGEQELVFLYEDEVKRLLESCDDSANTDLGTVVRICLATGACRSEAQDLRQTKVMSGRVIFTQTKNKKNRMIPISQKSHALLPKKQGNLFSPCYEAFSSVLKRAGIELPAGQCNDVLRHTFASHLHDTRWQCFGAATDIGAQLLHHDNAICAFCD